VRVHHGDSCMGTSIYTFSITLYSGPPCIPLGTMMAGLPAAGF